VVGSLVYTASAAVDRPMDRLIRAHGQIRTGRYRAMPTRIASEANAPTAVHAARLHPG
jgi:hypothetical protein